MRAEPPTERWRTAKSWKNSKKWIGKDEILLNHNKSRFYFTDMKIWCRLKARMISWRVRDFLFCKTLKATLSLIDWIMWIHEKILAQGTTYNTPDETKTTLRKNINGTNDILVETSTSLYGEELLGGAHVERHVHEYKTVFLTTWNLYTR